LEQTEYRVYICAGPNCGPKGSLSLVSFLEEEVERLGLGDRVTITAGGCQSHCETGPTMVVFPGAVFYQQVDRPRLERIAAEHLLAGEPVRDFFWNGVARKIIPSGSSNRQMPALPGPAPSKRSPGASARDDRKPRAKPRYEVDDFRW
jgi:(2Fe-2S) ferredoxin